MRNLLFFIVIANGFVNAHSVYGDEEAFIEKSPDILKNQDLSGEHRMNPFWLLSTPRNERLDGRANIRGQYPPFFKELKTRIDQGKSFEASLTLLQEELPVHWENGSLSMYRQSFEKSCKDKPQLSDGELNKGLGSLGEVSDAVRTIPSWICSLEWNKEDPEIQQFVTVSPEVVEFLKFYTQTRRGINTLKRWIQNSGLYDNIVFSALEKQGMPLFLAYLPMIESSYDPEDRSSQGALGIWQFMPQGGKIYGLQQDELIDERKNPIHSTDAALRYLADLRYRFGNWHLALAAFNAGYGSIERSMKQFNSNDYWRLRDWENGMPYSTRFYVPKLIAIYLILTNLEKFPELYQVQKRAAIYSQNGYVEVQGEGEIQLSKIAKKLDFSEDLIKKMNPDYQKRKTPLGKWTLFIPADKKEEFSSLDCAVKKIGEPAADLETLTQGNPSEENKDGDGDERGAIQQLIEKATSYAKKKVNPEVEGVILFPVLQQDPPVKDSYPIFYQPSSGDTINQIATQFGVTGEDIFRWNPMLEPTARLNSYLKIRIWVPIEKEKEFSTVAQLNRGKIMFSVVSSAQFYQWTELLRFRNRKFYRLEGETTKLSEIAKRLNIPSENLSRINKRATSDLIQPGTEIVYYAPMTGAEKVEYLSFLSLVAKSDFIPLDSHPHDKDVDGKTGLGEETAEKIEQKEPLPPIGEQIGG